MYLWKRFQLFFGGVEKGPLYDYNQFMKSLRNIAYAFVPKWLFYTIPFGGIKRIRDSSKSLDEYIRVLEKESTDKIDDRTTLLNMLIEANSDKKNYLKLLLEIIYLSSLSLVMKQQLLHYNLLFIIWQLTQKFKKG